MSSSSPRQNLAKDSIQGKGSNVNQQRANHRNLFISRLRALRIESFDKFRPLSENDWNYRSLVELRKLLVSQIDPKELVNQQELSEVIEELDKELSESEAELQFKQLERDLIRENQAIENSLLDRCELCDRFISQKGICESCAQLHFLSQF